MDIVTKCVNGVCTCILPLDRNDFRPLALRHRSLAFVSALLLSVKIIALLTVAVAPATAQLSTITVDRVIQLTNAERQKAGQRPLTVNPQLTLAAQHKGEDMLAHDYFAHISPSGVTPWFWMQQQGYTYQVAGENLAIDFVEVEDVVAAWMASPSHRDNMLHPAYTETGVAVVTGEFQGGTSTIVVHMFGLPTGNPSSVAPPAGGAKLDGDNNKPSPAPSPAPLPTAAPDTIPPRTPRIASVQGLGSAVAHTWRIALETEPGSTAMIIVNNKEVAGSVDNTGMLDLDVSQFPDGQLLARAYTKDTAGNRSELSDAISIQKDSTAPQLARSATAFVLSPQTDAPRVLASLSQAEATAVHVQQRVSSSHYSASDPVVIALQEGETTITVTDAAGNASETLTLALLPHYTVSGDSDATAPPARLNRMSRWLIGVVSMLVLALLSLAIFVRISIQRPVLIAHASLVLLLAGALFFL